MAPHAYGLACCVFALLLPLAPMRAQTSNTRAGFTVSQSNWHMRNAGTTVLLNGNADGSPVPSEVYYLPSGGAQSTFVGLSASWEGHQTALIETNALTAGSGFVSAITGAYGWVHDDTPMQRASLSTSLMISGAYLWGDVGEVGSRAGDQYLQAPDGVRYEAGSIIDIRGIALGVDASLGVSLRLTESAVLSATGGYRYMAPVTDWTYRVKTESGDQTSDLPSNGIDGDPPKLEMSGLLIRVGLQFAVPNTSQFAHWRRR